MNYQEFAGRLKLEHPQVGEVPYKLRDYQLDLLKKFDENDRTILVKSRQLGVSILIDFYAVYTCFEKPDTTIAILDPIGRSCRRNRITDFYEKWETKSNKKKGMVCMKNCTSFGNGSSIIVGTSLDDLEGCRPDIFIMDEFAFNKKDKEIYEESSCAHARNMKYPKTIFASTPNGINNVFYNLWKFGSRKEKITLPWNVIKRENHIEWRDNIIASIGTDNFQQEYECWFNPGKKQDKTEVMNIRLTETEKSDMEYIAKVKGFRSLSDYIRFLANRDQREEE